ncbi:MFS transporter [Pseudosulfitobacter koreensis]|uniref:MFS transporter n=1 Tax=Pseudosulfitobacter koreensis TaxID=2968472 RepID=A0ABT1YZF9_9RHOB|nr:MFS transporter [Pseudosulfitobacter koreense]MCR8826270.1 MFS transporter [Pseudosulfitobacter koreense]
MSIFNDLWISRKPLAGFLVIGTAWASYFAQMPVIKAGVGASDGAYGSVILLASLGAVGAMWLAPLADRLAGTWALPMGAMAVALGFLWAGVSPGLLGLMLALTIASSGSGVVDVLVNARLSEKEALHGRTLMNLNHAMYSFMYAGAAVVVGWAREAGWTPVQVFLVMTLLIACLCLVMLGDDAAPPIPETGEAPAAFPHLLVWLMGLLVLTGFLAEAGTEGWSALHLERTLGGGPAQGALGPAILGLTMGIGRLAGHAVARHMSEMILLACACLLSAFGVILAGAATSLMMAYLGFALGGLGVSIVVPMVIALAGRVVEPAARLTAISRVSVLGYGAFFVGPPLMGLVSEGWGLRTSFYMIGAMLILAAALLVPVIAAQISRRPA